MAVDDFMWEAVNEARLGQGEGGLPVGAVLVDGGLIVGRGRNRIVQNGDPTAHAEVECLRAAGRRASYAEAVLYTTMSPCLMCCGAIQHLGIKKVVVGETHTYEGFAELLGSANVELLDLDLDDLRSMVARWIDDHPQLWREAAGLGQR